MRTCVSGSPHERPAETGRVSPQPPPGERRRDQSVVATPVEVRISRALDGEFNSPPSPPALQPKRRRASRFVRRSTPLPCPSGVVNSRRRPSPLDDALRAQLTSALHIDPAWRPDTADAAPRKRARAAAGFVPSEERRCGVGGARRDAPAVTQGAGQTGRRSRCVWDCDGTSRRYATSAAKATASCCLSPVAPAS